MITITLQQIRDHKPCGLGWRNVKRAHFDEFGMDKPFPVSDMLKSNNVNDTLWLLARLEPLLSYAFTLKCASTCLPILYNSWLDEYEYAALHALLFGAQVEHEHLIAIEAKIDDIWNDLTLPDSALFATSAIREVFMLQAKLPQISPELAYTCSIDAFCTAVNCYVYTSRKRTVVADAEITVALTEYLKDLLDSYEGENHAS